MTETPRARLWRKAEAIGLRLVGIGTALYGGWFLYIGLGLGAVTGSDLELRLLAGGVGAAAVLAGILALARVREDLVGAILGAFTAAAFTLGAAQMTQPAATWRTMLPAAIFGALLLGFVAFRGAYRRP